LLRIANITDATGKVTTFGYTGSDLKIRSITDPFGRAVTFSYDPQQRLKSITDPIGIISSFTYDDASTPARPERIVAVTTPYGTSTVAYEGDPVLHSYSANWAITITDPEGFASRVERFYHDGYTPFTAGTHPEPRPPASIAVGTTSVPFLTTVPQADHFHVTLEWNKKQWYHYQTDLAANPNTSRFDYAQYTLWLMRPGDLYTTNVPIATKAPGESAIWYNYEGQTAGFKTGTSALPIKAARQVEDENGNSTWVMSQQTYNALGLPLLTTDERGRKTRIQYLANNRDPQTKQVLTAGPDTWSTVLTYGYPTPSLGLPSSITEASGVIKTFTRNALGQVTHLQISKGSNFEQIRFVYDTSGTSSYPVWAAASFGLLRRIERSSPDNPASFVTVASYTYDSVGRPRTHTDAGGYTRTFDYDDFDRPTLVTHPDGSTEQFAYDRLDLTASKDRAGRWSRTLHNPRRQPTALIAPDGDVTLLRWCLCGQLAQLTDPLGRVTKWSWDIGGRTPRS
jgi:YD repeat-containing protein